MNIFSLQRHSLKKQLAISIFLVLLNATICFLGKAIIGYKVVALILLMSVSILAMLFDIWPVLTAAVLSALIWNFFFIPPIFTFHISNTEDMLLFVLYFLIALVNAVLTFKIREADGIAREKEEKENTIKLYNTLLNSLSHELITPIATIIGAVDTLQYNRDNLTASNETELLHQIDLASTRLNKQVDNLLNMSRLDTGLFQLKYEWCDVNELILLTIQKIHAVSPKHPIHFVPDEHLPICKLDGGIMEQVLQNLFSNAVQYNPEYTFIEVKATVQNNRLSIHIVDEGNGLSDEQLNAIFDKFYRAATQKTGGLGLGLSIAKGFVEAHKGSISASHHLPNGLQFTISIPVETSYLNNLKNE